MVVEIGTSIWIRNMCRKWCVYLAIGRKGWANYFKGIYMIWYQKGRKISLIARWLRGINIWFIAIFIWIPYIERTNTEIREYL